MTDRDMMKKLTGWLPTGEMLMQDFTDRPYPVEVDRKICLFKGQRVAIIRLLLKEGLINSYE